MSEKRLTATLPRPWAEISNPVPKLLTVSEAMKAGGLDWEVAKRAIVTADESHLDVPDHFAIVRYDTQKVLGVVGKQYTIVQNRDAFSFFDFALGERAATIESVGVIGDGARVFAVAKLPDTVEIVPGDPVEHFILLVTSHDGSSSLQAVFTPTRLLCQNMLAATLKVAKQCVRLKHTKHVNESIKVAHTVLHQEKFYWQKIQGAFRYMATKDADEARLKEVLEEMFPARIDSETQQEYVASQTQEARDRVTALFDGEALGADKAGHTDWGIYNAITYYIDHERNNRVGTRWESSVFGTGVAMRQRAFDILVRN